MKVIVIMHDPAEGPGTIEDYLLFKRIDVYKVRLYQHDLLPQSFDDVDAVVTMGGPMNVYEDDRYPFLGEEATFLSQIINRNIPVLGICLGAQMIARSCGASVFKASQKEIGFSEVTLTESGKEDILFRGISNILPVFQWHEDTFDIPDGGNLLATSPLCHNQAFRYSNAYGLQFHVEVTPRIISGWFGATPGGEEMICHLEKIEVGFTRQALRLYGNFVALMKEINVNINPPILKGGKRDVN